MYKINKQKCTGCRACIQTCFGATEIREDGKAEIVDQEKLAACGGKSVCPFNAIEEVLEGQSVQQISSLHPSRDSFLSSEGFFYPSPSSGRRGLGRRRGLSRSREMGRGRRGRK